MNTDKQIEVQHRESNTLFMLFGLWTFILLCRPQDYFTVLGHIRPNLTLGIITLLLGLTTKLYEFNKTPSKQLRYYYCLVALLVLGIPFSLYRRGSLMDLINYGSVVMFVYLFYRVVTTTKKLTKLIHIYCLGVCVYAVYILKFGTLTGERMSFGEMFDPNDIAFFILSFIFFNIIFLTKNNRMPIRLISAFSMLVGIIVIIKTGSRGGLLSLMAVLLFLVFARFKTIRLSFFTKTVVAVAAILSLQFMDMSTDRYKTIMNITSDYNVTDEEGRVSIWKIGMRLMLTHPLTGVGLNQFPHGVGMDREARGLPSAKWHTAHNSMVQIGAETGILGLILFCLMSFNVIKITGYVINKSQSEELVEIAEMTRAGFIGHFISAMFLSQAYSVYWAFYIVLSAVLKYLSDKEFAVADGVY